MLRADGRRSGPAGTTCRETPASWHEIGVVARAHGLAANVFVDHRFIAGAAPSLA